MNLDVSLVYQSQLKITVMKSTINMNETVRYSIVMHGPVIGWECGQAVVNGKIERTYHETTRAERDALLKAKREANPDKYVGIQYNY